MATAHFKQNLGMQKCSLAMQILILLHQPVSFSGHLLLLFFTWQGEGSVGGRKMYQGGHETGVSAPGGAAECPSPKQLESSNLQPV